MLISRFQLLKTRRASFPVPFCRAFSNTRFYIIAATLMALTACSGVDITADSTDAFVASDYTRYAWRSAPPTLTASTKDKLPQKSPIIRASFEKRMSELGYERVSQENAEFLVEYLVIEGYNDGQLLRGGSNEQIYGSAVNRQVDGALVDNARALSNPVETGNIVLLFFDAKSTEVLWRVQMSIVVEDANRIDEAEVMNAVRAGLARLPSHP